MHATDPSELLSDYVRNGSGNAFGEIVRRHIDLVYSTALRRVAGDAHLARDVVQLVFTDLALKARALPTGVVLGGWLHHHTCFRAATLVRAERRRRDREQKAADMKAIEESTDGSGDRLGSLLDDALERLPARDRDALVLRFFEGKSLAETGRVFGLSDDAAQKLVSRAVEKLRAHFAARGLATGSAALAAALSGSAAHAAPAGLATATAQASLAALATLPLRSLVGIWLWSLVTKHKFLTGAAAVVAIALLVLWRDIAAPSAPSASMSRPASAVPAASVAAPAPVIAVAAAESAAAPTSPASVWPADTDRLSASEVLGLMGRVYATCTSYFDSGIAKTTHGSGDGSWTRERPFRTVFVRPDRYRYEFWNEGNGQGREHNYIVWANGNDVQTWWPLHEPNTQVTTLELAVAGATGISMGSAHTIPTLLLEQLGGRKLTELAGATRAANELVDGTDCIRIDGLSGKFSTTLWIDQATGAVRRMRQKIESPAGAETITTYTAVLNRPVPDELLQFDPPPQK